MTDSTSSSSEVLVIGAGPSGLFAAVELARQGVAVRLIDQAPQPHHQARATSIQPGTLEILNAIGLLPPFLEASQQVHGVCICGPDLTLLRAQLFAGIDCCCDFACSLPQYETERILEAQLIAWGGAVERGTTATQMTPTAEGMMVELALPSGRTETATAGVVIDAGGAHGLSHRSSQDALEGETYAGQFIVADIAAPLELPRDRTHIICSSLGPLLLAPLPRERWLTFLQWEQPLSGPVDGDMVAEGVEIRLNGKHRPSDVAWASSFHGHRRITRRFCEGPRYLVGDAAHLSSPFGGEGLNAGMHDAFNLAWKLALTRRGRARESLLDSYAVERQIADRHVLQTSDDVHHTVFAFADAVRQGKTPPAEVVNPVEAALLLNARVMIDIDYQGSPLVVDLAAGEALAAMPRPGQRYPEWWKLGAATHHLLVFGPVAAAEALAEVERRWSNLVRVGCRTQNEGVRAGVPGGGLVVVRPDGHIGLRATATDAGALGAVDRHLASYLIPE